ncbi:MAG TPA: dethiobiotin synthase [Holophagaceae bacterium]|nr:dethiobiotin synthase [Holophagaceae bacterium]
MPLNFLDLPSPLWVLGTDTGVGKTHVSGRISRAWAAAGPVAYRKPFQSGVRSLEDPDSDPSAVKGPGITVECHTVLQAPLSPLAAAELEGRSLDLDDALAWCRRPAPGRVLLEGVGGVMVPLAEGRHFLAWATELGFPCVLVARGGLGTLNHTLLSCEALMMRGWRIAAVLLNPGVDESFEAAPSNADLLRRFLPIPVEILDPRKPDPGSR